MDLDFCFGKMEWMFFFIFLLLRTTKILDILCKTNIRF